MIHLKNIRRKSGAVCLFALSALTFTASSTVYAAITDHHEFEASLHVPYRAAANARAGDESRTFTLDFSFPHNQKEQTVAWKLELLTPSGRVVQTWNGAEKLLKQAVLKQIYWAGRTAANANALPDGVYQLRLTAAAVETKEVLGATRKPVPQLVNEVLLHNKAEVTEQSWPMQVGVANQVAMPAFAPMNTGKSPRQMSAPPAAKTTMAPAVPATNSL